MRSRRTCCRRKVCPFSLARPPSERFCSDRGRTSGHCTSKRRLGSKLGFVWRRPQCPHPLHSSRIRLFLSHPTLSSQATSGAGVSCRRGGRRTARGYVPRSARRLRMMANVRAERLLKTPAEPSPELRIPALQLKRECLHGRNSARILGIRPSFQRDNLRRHF
jgi:hypothetical protein